MNELEEAEELPAREPSPIPQQDTVQVSVVKISNYFS